MSCSLYLTWVNPFKGHSRRGTKQLPELLLLGIDEVFVLCIRGVVILVINQVFNGRASTFGFRSIT